MTSATTLSEPRVTSGAWMPKGSRAPLTAADPSIFADAEEDDSVRIPSGDAGLCFQPDPKLASAALLLASASRLPSIPMNIDLSKPIGSGPSDWLTGKIPSASFLASLPNQPTSSFELLKNLGFLDAGAAAAGAMFAQMPPLPPTAVTSATQPLTASQLSQPLTQPIAAPLAPALPDPTASAPASVQEVVQHVFNENEIKKWDVLCGRGGKSNHHPGNKRYRQVVNEMKNKYRGTAAKTDKTALSRAIVDYVNAYGGRFLKKNSKTGKWVLLTKAEARKKTSQALRETKELKWTL